MRDAIRHENGIPATRRHLAALSTMVVIVLVGVVAAIVVGLGRAIDWVGSYLVPVAVITGVVIACLALLVWVVKRLPESPSRDRYQ